MASSAWAEQQVREMSLRARQLSKAKTDPEEERRLLARQRQASLDQVETVTKRHLLVLKKRDLARKRQEEASQKDIIKQLLAAEGLELEDENAL
ncbi:hypothetical protein CBR_g28090 [Chara braunii]|uniref:Uncharacterized protein n=1 Tax=Chara braunii TaxID=69332 RepID=A0A388L978_CHABU|nr:hypothetical protein CBR_g28090 [Chara braunii]|eukprot:GBG78865.1 hypothetical protein CBR_g28090 [Chara braunii]